MKILIEPIWGRVRVTAHCSESEKASLLKAYIVEHYAEAFRCREHYVEQDIFNFVFDTDDPEAILHLTRDIMEIEKRPLF
jgi:hypothetical protein